MAGESTRHGDRFTNPSGGGADLYSLCGSGADTYSLSHMRAASLVTHYAAPAFTTRLEGVLASCCGRAAIPASACYSGSGVRWRDLSVRAGDNQRACSVTFEPIPLYGCLWRAMKAYDAYSTCTHAAACI